MIQNSEVRVKILNIGVMEMKSQNKQWIMGLVGLCAINGSSLAANQLYGGFDSGYSHFRDTKRIVSTQYVRPGVAVPPVISNVSSSAGGFLYGAFVGVNHVFSNRFDLALEVNIDGMSSRIKQDNSPSGGTSKSTLYENMDSMIGISVLPGYFISPKTKLFVRASVGAAHFSSNVNGILNPGTAKGYQGSFSHRGLYYGFGLGASTMLSKHLSLGFEGDHYWVHGFKNISSVPNPDASGTIPATVAVDFHPSVTEAKLTLSYRFN